MNTSENNHHHLNPSSMETSKWCCHESLHKFHGFWFTQTYLQTTQKVLQNLKPLPTDIILASFPKTGTTWLKALLHSIIHRSPSTDDVKNPNLFLNHPQELIPSLETNLYVKETTEDEILVKIPEFSNAKEDKKFRILATHIPYQILCNVVKSSECKIVYVTRNPKDTLISLWHFVKKSENFALDPWELEAAVDQFCQGVVPFGSYYDHVLGYREESVRSPEKVFFVTFEELKENPKNLLLELAEFLGGCPFDENGEEKVEEIVKNCSFENLSSQEVNRSSELPPSGFPLPYSSFFRKGEVGDHMNYLDDEMIGKIDAITREKFHGSGFMYGI